MTSKTKRYDLDTILTESQSLNTYDPNKKTRKGWAELSYATDTLSKHDHYHQIGGNKMDIMDQKAFHLLSQHAFDAQSLMKEVNSMELKAQYEPVERLEGTDIEGYLLHHHEMILFSAIDEARKIADEDVQKIQRKWATDEWATSRRQLMDSLGHRSNIFAQSEKHQHHPSQTPFKVPETPQTVGKDLSSIYLQTPRVLRSPVSEFSQTPSIVPTPTADKNTKSSRPPLEQSELMRKHAEVVRLLRTSAESSSQRSSASLTVQNQQNFAPATTLATQLEGASHSPSLLSDAKAAGMKESDIPAYRNLLQLLASMTGEFDGQTRPPGYFSPVALDLPALSAASLSEKKKILSSGSRHFLEKQFENMLVAKVDSSRSTFGREDSSNTILAGKNRLERIRMYTAFKSKARQLPPVCSRCVDNPLAYGLVPPQRGTGRSSSGDIYNGVPIWPQVYFCLRTGDLKDAHTLLKSCLDEGINGVDEAAYVALGELLKLNQRNSDGGYRPHQISSVLSALSKCNALYRETLSGSASSNGYDFNRQNANEQGNELSQPDPYRLQVLSLLGLADLDALCEGAYLADTTVEDFLWTSLWFVHYTQLLSNSFIESTTADADLPQVVPSFVQSKSYTPGMKSGPPTPASFSSFNSPSRVASTGDRFRTKFDLIDPLSQTPIAKDRNMTPSNIRRMHSEHLPKVYREGDIYLRVMDAGGADYFDPGMANPFTYSLILFCCLRFEEAISHLWHAGWAFPSIHLLVLCLHYGLILPHLPLVSSGTLSHEDNQTTPANLLSLWISTKFAALDSCQKADYILSLNSQWVVFVRELDANSLEICRNKSDVALLTALESLICSLDKYDLGQLVGEESESTGLRISGYLDIYLEREVIQRVLAQTAYSLITSRRDLLRGIQLYELAGMYVEVIEELCNQLSLVALTTSARSQDAKSTRTFWKEYCEGFYQKLNSQTRGAAIAARLQQEGRLNLRVLFETLLNVCLFVDLHGERRYQEALELLDNLKLLPSRSISDSSTGDDGFTACIQRFSRLESPLKRLMDDVIVMTMDCIYGLYAMAKMEGSNGFHRDSMSSSSRENISNILQQLRHRASVLITFVGYVQNNLIRPTETAKKLSDVEVRMM